MEKRLIMVNNIHPIKFEDETAKRQKMKNRLCTTALWIALFYPAFSIHAQTTGSGEPLASSTAANLAVEKRMDFAFQDIPVRALLQLLGETAGVNIVTDESVNGTITLNLKNAGWREALDVIVRAKNLQTENIGNTVYVRGPQQFRNEAVVGDGGAWSVAADPYRQQVLIEARIVEAEDSFSRTLGVKLGFNDRSRLGYRVVPDPNDATKTITIAQPVSSGSAVFGGTSDAVQGLSGQTILTDKVSAANQMINFPAIASPGGVDPASFAMSLFNSSLTRFVNLEISALETDGKGKIISNPRVVTSNNVKAVIEQGTEIPYQQSTSSGATSVSFRKANLKLEVTPQIVAGGEVMLDVDVTKDSVGVQTTQGYAINTKHVKTQVKIDNGGTLVIGGIYQEDSRKAVDKVPLLGDIPLLGNLFKTTTRSVKKNELLIFLTPHLLDARGNILPAKNAAIRIDE